MTSASYTVKWAMVDTHVRSTLHTEKGPVRPFDMFYAIVSVYMYPVWLQKLLEPGWFSFIVAYYHVIQVEMEYYDHIHLGVRE